MLSQLGGGAPRPWWAGPGPGAGVGPGSPRRGAGPIWGAPGRCRARLVDGSDRSPGHQGVRPPTGPAFPAVAWPIREAFTGGWAQPAQLLRGSGMVTSSRGGGGARGGPIAPHAARAGAGEVAGVHRTPGEGEGQEGLGRGARERGWVRGFGKKGWGRP